MDNKTLIAVLIVAAMVLASVVYLVGSARDQQQAAASVPQVTVVPTPVPTPAPPPTPAVPTTIVFTALSTTMSPNYEVTTTSGQILYCTDYYTWNIIVPRNTYTAVVTAGNVISNPVLINGRYRYNQYDYNYYQQDYERYNYRDVRYYDERPDYRYRSRDIPYCSDLERSSSKGCILDPR